ncbi:hypothetical protein Q7P37_006227 [Cladosporium fusiforme]
MVSFTSAALTSIAAAGLIQYAPAPFVALPVVISINMGSAAAWAGAAGGIAGGAAATASAIQGANKKRSVGTGSDSWVKVKRQDDAQFGTQLAWELCRDDVQSATVAFEVPEPGSLLVSGVPSTCMTLATTITGEFNAGHPVPMGNDAIKFTDLPQQYIDDIVAALNARGD